MAYAGVGNTLHSFHGTAKVVSASKNPRLDGFARCNGNLYELRASKPKKLQLLSLRSLLGSGEVFQNSRLTPFQKENAAIVLSDLRSGTYLADLHAQIDVEEEQVVLEIELRARAPNGMCDASPLNKFSKLLKRLEEWNREHPLEKVVLPKPDAQGSELRALLLVYARHSGATEGKVRAAMGTFCGEHQCIRVVCMGATHPRVDERAPFATPNGMAFDKMKWRTHVIDIIHVEAAAQFLQLAKHQTKTVLTAFCGG
jgi:hypothetical protein